MSVGAPGGGANRGDAPSHWGGCRTPPAGCYMVLPDELVFDKGSAMSEQLLGWTIEPVLPADGRTFPIQCRTAPGRRGVRHDVSLTADWQLETPHDLESERIGVAFGGHLTCVELADQILPAVRGWLEHLHRAAPADIERASRTAWAVVGRVPGCGCDQPFKTAGAAAGHLRDPRHWARRHGVRVRAVTDVATLILGREPADPRCPLPYCTADDYLVEPSGLDRLWDAGVHFARVPDLVAAIGPAGQPLHTRHVIERAYATPAEAWVLQFAPAGRLVLDWARATRSPRDERDPRERQRWIAAGASLSAVGQVFAGDAYTLADAHAYAATVGVTFAEAAAVLGRHQSAGRTPPLADLVARATAQPTRDQRRLP